MRFTSRTGIPLEVDVRIKTARKDHIATNLPLTGYAVWFGAENMCDFASANVDSFRDKRVLELGSGLGLAGISIAAMLAADPPAAAAAEAASAAAASTSSTPLSNQPEVQLGPRHESSSPSSLSPLSAAAAFVLTDGEAELLPALRENCAQNRVDTTTNTSCEVLWWGNKTHTAAIKSAHPGGFDVIVGADLVYNETQLALAVPALFATAKELLSHDLDARFFLAVTRRNFGVTNLLEEASKAGFNWRVDEETIYDLFDNLIDEQTLFWRDCVYVFSRREPGQPPQAASCAQYDDESFF
jgi:predicted nicotinamide N-methyase